MLKFENKFSVGDRIRAYDFPPMEDTPDRFIEGVITSVSSSSSAYVVSVENDTVFTKQPRDEVMVPFEVFFLEFDQRVTAI